MGGQGAPHERSKALATITENYCAAYGMQFGFTTPFDVAFWAIKTCKVKEGSCEWAREGGETEEASTANRQGNSQRRRWIWLQFWSRGKLWDCVERSGERRGTVAHLHATHTAGVSLAYTNCRYGHHEKADWVRGREREKQIEAEYLWGLCNCPVFFLSPTLSVPLTVFTSSVPPCVFSSPSPLCYTLPLCLSATCACAAPPKLKLANNSSRLNLSCFEFQFTFLFRFQFHSISNLCCLPLPTPHSPLPTSTRKERLIVIIMT